MRPYLVIHIIPLVSCWLAGCATTDASPGHYLDPQTAVTVTSMARPWVYARDEPALAANARDYLHAGLLEVNQAGERRYWLVVTSWTTIDRSSLGFPGHPLIEGLRVERQGVDAIRLVADPRGRRAAGTSRAYFEPPGAARMRDHWFELTVAQLTELAVQPPTAISIEGADGVDRTFVPWRVDAAAARALIADIAPRSVDSATRPRP